MAKNVGGAFISGQGVQIWIIDQIKITSRYCISINPLLLIWMFQYQISTLRMYVFESFDFTVDIMRIIYSFTEVFQVS